MTFRSLYRLEKRGLLDCPIVGVAVDDWTVDQLRERARESIVGTGEQLDTKVFDRLAARLSYVQGDFADAATYGRVARGDRGGRDTGLLPRDPALPLRPRRQGARRGGPDADGPGRRGEAVRPRPGLGPRAGRRAAPVHRRVAALPDRPLPREDGPRARSSTSGSRTRCSSPSGTGTTSRPCRSRWRRTSGSKTVATSTTPSARSATSSSTTSCRWSRRRRWSRPAGRDPEVLKDGMVALFRAIEPADPAHYVRGQYDGYTDIDGVAPDSTTETYAALRLDIENWRWSGVPFFIRTGKLLPDDADRGPARLQARAAARLRRARGQPGAEPARDQARSLDRDPVAARRPAR